GGDPRLPGAGSASRAALSPPPSARRAAIGGASGALWLSRAGDFTRWTDLESTAPDQRKMPSLAPLRESAPVLLREPISYHRRFGGYRDGRAGWQTRPHWYRGKKRRGSAEIL